MCCVKCSLIVVVLLLTLLLSTELFLFAEFVCALNFASSVDGGRFFKFVRHPGFVYSSFMFF